MTTSQTSYTVIRTVPAPVQALIGGLTISPGASAATPIRSTRCEPRLGSHPHLPRAPAGLGVRPKGVLPANLLNYSEGLGSMAGRVG